MDNPESPVDLAGLGLDEHDFYDGPPISDLLGRELDVKVNSTVWQNVLVHMDDDGEEATIVLYGLMPGRHYEVELNVVSGKEPIAIRKHVVTDADSSTLILSNSSVERSLNMHDSGRQSNFRART
jgi:hypothetical protein